MRTTRNTRGQKKKGFTLIELVMAIAIMAVVSITVIVLVNPINVFREARDSQRIADVEQMNRVMGLYSANIGNPSASECDNKCYVGLGSGTTMLNQQGLAIPRCGQRYSATTNNTTVTSTVQAIDGTGWVPIDLRPMSESIGVPIAGWPIDPKTVVVTNNSTSSPQVIVTSSQYYSFACLNGGWEFTARLESARYASSNAETDGGTDLRLYEVGTNVGL